MTENRLRIEIIDVASSHILIQANYPVRSEHSVDNGACGGGSIIHIYEGYEVDTEQRPIWSLNLGPKCPDDWENGTVIEFLNGEQAKVVRQT